MYSKAIREEKFLVRDAEKRFVKKKILGFYPEMIVGLLIGGVVQLCFLGGTWIENLKIVVKVFLDGALLQVIKGMFSLPGGVMWYLSAMIIGGAIIYPCLLKKENGL